MASRALLRIGAACALVGAPLAIVVNLLHPPLPSRAEDALRLIARTCGWPLIHLGIIAALLLLAGALPGIAAAAGGAGSLLEGVGFFVHAGWAVPVLINVLAFLLTLWIFTMGGLLWRGAGAA